MVESGILKLLVPERMLNIPKSIKKQKDKLNIRAAHINTEVLIDEVSNLKRIDKPNGKMSIEQVSLKTDKDIFSALSYILYYLNKYENKKIEEKNDLDVLLSYTIF
jgi:ribonucleoside-diphosphate reductase alpha chain